MAIHKGPVRDNFTLIPNHTHRDTNLSLQARGLLGYLLSLPDYWIVRPIKLAKDNNIGRNTAYKIIAELKENGYIIQIQDRSVTGKFSSGDYLVFRSVEDAQWYAETLENSDVQPCTKKRDAVKRDTVKRQLTKKELLQKKESSSKPAPAVFDFDLVLAWILTTLKAVHDLNALDEAFIEASLEEYQNSAEKPSKSRALSWVETGLKQRIGTERRSAKASYARDNLNNSVVNHLDAQAMVVDQHTGNMSLRSGKLMDRTWDDETA